MLHGHLLCSNERARRTDTSDSRRPYARAALIHRDTMCRAHPRRTDRHHSVFTAWPPNSLRSAARTLAPYESACRERNRVSNDSVITGAGTS
jgi:hypothetical protein